MYSRSCAVEPDLALKARISSFVYLAITKRESFMTAMIGNTGSCNETENGVSAILFPMLGCLGYEIYAGVCEMT